MNFQHNYERILAWLLNHEHHIIGVCGMGGVGKTTLLMQIHNTLLQDSNFCGRVYWVTVSENWSVHKLQEDIAKVIGMEKIEEADGRKRAAILHNKLAANGPTVLILDDMWERFAESEVGIPLEGSSCKIVLSTRSQEVCRKMGCKDFVIKAEILQESEAWDLFVDRLGHYDTLTVKAKEIVRYVAEECGGLPLAITTMARSLSEIVDIHEWHNALNELRQPVHGQDDMKHDVLRVLQYSYERLNDKMVQNCFLSCILYPEDHHIKRTTLIDLWINEGLLDEIQSREDKVVKGHSMINILVNSCLLESTGDHNQKKYVKMHDLIRDMAIMMTKESPRFMAKSGLMLRDVPEEERWSKDLKKVSLSHNYIKEIPCGMAPVTPLLTVLLLSYNDIRQIPESFFMHMRSLTVLDLSYTNIESLPESVSNLENLRALLLKQCHFLKDLPSVAKLTKLRILTLFDTEIADRSMISMIPPEGIESLNLKVLSFGKWEMFDDVIRFNRLIKSWQGCDELYWTRLELSGKDTDKSFYDYFDENGKTVVIDSIEYKEELPILPSTITGLAVINISAFKYQSLGKLFPTLAGTKELKSLWLGECEGLEYILISEAVQLDSVVIPSLDTLEKLWVKSMPDLRGLSNSLSVSTFSHIKELIIWSCPKIRVWFPWKLLQQGQALFPLMETLRVEDCDELEEIFEGGGRDSCSSSSSSLQSEKVTVLDLNASNPNPNLILVDLPRLKELTLQYLPKLRRIYRHLHLYTSLEELVVCGSREIEQIIEASAPTLALPKLRQLRLQNLPKLSSIYSVLLMCTSVVDLRIIDVACMKVVFPCQLVEQEQPLLPKLERLFVCSCYELEEIFEGDGREKVRMLDLDANNPKPNPILVDLPILRVLLLRHLPKLRRIHRHLNLCTSLHYLRVEDCAEIEQIFEVSKPTLALPQLQSVYLPKLSSIYRGLLVCTSLLNLNRLEIIDLACMKVVFPCKLVEQEQPLLPNLEKLHVSGCDELEEIFEGGGRYSSCSQSENVRMLDLNASNPNHNSILVDLPKLSKLILRQLPKLRRIYRHLHLCLSLQELSVEDCAEIEHIFEASKPTLALPQLGSVSVENLPKLSSIHKGLLLCTSRYHRLSVENYWKLNQLPLLSKHLICDASPTALLSLPTDSQDPELWDLLCRNYPEDASLLSTEIGCHQKHQLKQKRKRADLLLTFCSSSIKWILIDSNMEYLLKISPNSNCYSKMLCFVVDY